MHIKITVDNKEDLEKLAGLSMRDKLEIWAEAVQQKLQKNAEQRLGGQFGIRIAGSVRYAVNNTRAKVHTDNTKDGYIGNAVHAGGDFRSRKGKLLALPLHSRFRPGGAEAGTFPSKSKLNWEGFTTSNGEQRQRKVHGMFFLTSKKGNLLLFERKRKGKPKETEGPLFLLRKSFHHKPRPWWITPAEAEETVADFVEENF